MTAGLAIVLFVVGLKVLYRVFGGNEERWRDYVQQRGGRARGRQLNEGYDLTRHGIEMWLHGFRRGDWNDPLIEVRAAVRVPVGFRLWVSGPWSDHAVPRLSGDVRTLPPVSTSLPGEVRTDRPDVLLRLDALARAWRRIASTQTHAVVACDGRAVSCVIGDPELSDDVLDAMLDAVAALAAWDDGFTARLRALPAASAVGNHELDPAVALAPDGLVVGVLDRAHTVAQLDVRIDDEPAGALRAMLDAAGDGELSLTATRARFTWRTIERDPARLRAAVDALRALAARSTPYR